MKLKRSIVLIYGYAVINTVVLLIITILLQNQPYLYKDESILLTANKFLKYIALGLGEKPASDRFLFINTAYDNQLITKFDETGTVPIGNEPAVDREKLGLFFQIINENPDYNFVICDIYFDAPTENDSLLKSELSRLNRSIVPYHMSELGLPQYPLFKGPLEGLVVVDIVYDEFVKYKLFQNDTLKSLPLMVYEELHHTKIGDGWYVRKLNDRLVADYFIPEFRIRNFDLLEAHSYALVNLGELLLLDNQSIHELTENRIVVIGDFIERDNFETHFGEISGPLLLTNVLLSLEYGDNVISFWFVLYICISFFLLSVMVFHPHDFVEERINKLKVNDRLKKLVIGISYFSFLILISSLGYFLFNFTINIFFLSVYLFLLDLIWNRKKEGITPLDV